MSNRYHVTVTFDIDVADLDAVQAAAPALMHQLIHEQGGGVQGPFVDNADQAAAYVGLDPKAAMDMVVSAAIRRGLNTPELAGSRWATLSVSCAPR